MDLDRALVSAILREGKPAMQKAVEKGVRDEFLATESQHAFLFINEFIAKYDAFPTPAEIQGKLGYSIIDTTAPAEFYIDEVLNRRLHDGISSGLKGVVSHLEKRDPKSAYLAYESNLRVLRKDQHVVQKSVNLLTLAPDFLAYYDKLKAGITGVLTPWRSINESTLGFWPEDFVLVVARLGIGKCLDTDTVLTNPITGVQSRLGAVFESPEFSQALTWSKERGIHAAPITAKVDTGRKECLRFVLDSGREVIVTPEHPFLTPSGWVKAEDMLPGGSLAVVAQQPLPQQPVGLPPAAVDLLAVYLADGSCTQSGANFTKADSEIVRIATEAVESLGGELRSDDGLLHRAVCAEGRQCPGGNPVLELLREHGLKGVLSKDKTIPEAVFRLDAAQLGRFIAVFWMCDGYVTDQGAEITLASRELLVQLQSLLTRLGVQSRLAYKRAKYQGGWKDAWRLRVYASSYARFLEAIPIWGTKQETLAELAALEKNPNVGLPVVSEAFKAELRAEIDGRIGRWRGGPLKRVGERLGWKTHFGFRNLFGRHGTLLLERFRIFCEEFDCVETYSWLWDSGLWWDSVVSIESAGERKIFDLTMEPTECFVANDIIVHNTWFLTLLAEHAWATQKKRVLFASTEMSKERILQRFYALHMRLPYEEFRKAKLGVFVEQKFREQAIAMQAMDGLFIVGGDFDFRVESLEAAIDDCEPDLVLLDGAYLLKGEGEGRTEKASNSFDDIKRLAKRCRVPLVATTQFNREAKVNSAKSASVEKIALSDAAGWNADLIYGLVQTEDMKRDGRMILKPMKFREGIGEDVECLWDFATMDFREVGEMAPSHVKPRSAGTVDDDPYSTGLDFGSDDGDSGVPF